MINAIIESKENTLVTELPIGIYTRHPRTANSSGSPDGMRNDKARPACGKRNGQRPVYSRPHRRKHGRLDKAALLGGENGIRQQTGRKRNCGSRSRAAQTCGNISACGADKTHGTTEADGTAEAYGATQADRTAQVYGTARAHRTACRNEAEDGIRL